MIQKLLALAMLCASMRAAQMVTVTTTLITDSTGALVTGSIHYQPTDNQGEPLGYRVPSQGQVIPQTVDAVLTNGVSSIQIFDTTQTQPANICYNVWATNTKNQVIMGSKTGTQHLTGYGCVQVNTAWCSNSICNFDIYPPNYPALGVIALGPQGPTGPQGPAGSGGSGGGSGISVITVNNSNYTILSANTAVIVTGATGIRTITLPDPAAACVSGVCQTVLIKDGTGEASSYAIIVAAPGVTSADGHATLQISANYGSMRLLSNGTNWYTIP